MQTPAQSDPTTYTAAPATFPTLEESASPAIDQLAAALAKAQGEFEMAAKDAANPHLGSRYADLASVIRAFRAPLAKNGLAVVQRATTALREDLSSGVVTVRTSLLHASGQHITDVCELPVLPMTRKGGATDKCVSPQAVGSAITYARRYSLSALLCLAAGVEDDDGAAASSGGQRQAAARQDRPATPSADLVAFGALKGKAIDALTGEELSAAIDFGEGKITEAKLAVDAGEPAPAWLGKVAAGVARLRDEAERRLRGDAGASA
jgi:hypothetical protein